MSNKPLVTVQWNTGKHYAPEGQRIIAGQRTDGSVIFSDLTRNIHGVLTNKSGYHGGNREGIKIFKQSLPPEAVRSLVTTSYCDGYSYEDLWTPSAERMTWID